MSDSSRNQAIFDRILSSTRGADLISLPDEHPNRTEQAGGQKFIVVANRRGGRSDGTSRGRRNAITEQTVGPSIGHTNLDAIGSATQGMGDVDLIRRRPCD